MKKRPSFDSAITYCMVVLFALLFILVGNRITRPQGLPGQQTAYYTAQVVAVGESEFEEFSLDSGQSYLANETVYFTARLTGGPLRGRVIEMSQLIDALYAYQPPRVEDGNRIIVAPIADEQTGDTVWLFVEHDRTATLVLLLLLFLGLVVLFGRAKGVATVLSLLFTCGVVFAVYIPGILQGRNIYLLTCIIALYIILISLLLINGANRKTLCAILGNLGGVAVAGALAAVMSALLNLTGMVDQNYIYLTFLDTSVQIDLRAVVWGGVVIGSLGAVMDVAMSLASSMNELAQTMRDRSPSAMLRSGMNIGRDAIGTMTNTLILAYIGSSLATVLLLSAYNTNLLYLLNTELIMVELLQASAGSIGILFAVPITVCISTAVFCGKRRTNPHDADAQNAGEV